MIRRRSQANPIARLFTGHFLGGKQFTWKSREPVMTKEQALALEELADAAFNANYAAGASERRPSMLDVMQDAEFAFRAKLRELITED